MLVACVLSTWKKLVLTCVWLCVPRLTLPQCKSEVCSDVLQQHVDRKAYKAGVWLMGHTSSDPTVDLSPGATRKRKVCRHPSAVWCSWWGWVVFMPRGSLGQSPGEDCPWCGSVQPQALKPKTAEFGPAKWGGNLFLCLAVRIKVFVFRSQLLIHTTSLAAGSTRS